MAQVIENIGGEYRNRTGVHGFAIRCVTTPPTRRSSVFFTISRTWLQVVISIAFKPVWSTSDWLYRRFP